jgi:cephalosporin-C deacetylase-like acetyl esterase
MAHRDSRIEQFKDFGRSIDYLETRNDIDSKKIGFYGISWGGGMGAQFPALEERIKLSVLVHAGLRMEPALPEVDQINFVTRVKVPTLMLSGIYDFDFRPETSQIPMFNLLGTPLADKKRITYDVGHQFLPERFPKDALPWLDKYFGPVISATKNDR